ncbi:MAG: methyltransferase domain-containing protein [Rhodobacteraceae bacterium]|nr:methyltransferase domain-containing protein [Paracoccaceae bacterium]
MKAAPSLFDRPALRAHRKRASPDAMFLHELARDEIQDRLAMVNKRFTKPAIITPFGDIWAADFPDAVVVEDQGTLSLSEGRFDLVIHAMCLHWAEDPVGQLIQCRRALTEDGLCLVILLGGQTLNELRSVLAQAESTVTGGLSPRIAPMAEIRDMGGLLQRAGLTLPVADSVPHTVTYRDMTHLMHDLRAMGEANALAGRLRHPTRRKVFEVASELYQKLFGADGGRINASFELICLTGWSPSESQPKPKRPGSAQTRLADALNVTEHRLPD